MVTIQGLRGMVAVAMPPETTAGTDHAEGLAEESAETPEKRAARPS